LCRRLDLEVQSGIDDEPAGIELSPEPIVQHLPDPLLEIGGGPLPGLRLGFRERPLLPPLCLCFLEVSFLNHKTKDQVSAVECVFRAFERIVVCRAVGDGCQEGGFGDVQVRGTLTEVVSGRGLDAVPSSIVVDLVDVGFQDLVLSVGPLQRHGYLKLLQLPGNPFFETDALCEHVPGQLLGDGTPAATGEGTIQKHPDNGAGEPTSIEPVVGIETFVLNGDEGLGNELRKGFDGYGRPAFQPDLGDEPSIMAQELAGLFRLPCRNLCDGRAVETEVLPRTPETAHGPRGQEACGQEEGVGKADLPIL